MSIQIQIPECVCGRSDHHDEDEHPFQPVKIDRTSPAWEAILDEANAVGWPLRYTSDLFRDWQDIERHQRGAATSGPFNPPFVWVLRENGTQMLYIDDLGESGDVRRRDTVGYVETILGLYPEARWYKWDGAALLSTTPAAVKDEILYGVESAAS